MSAQAGSMVVRPGRWPSAGDRGWQIPRTNSNFLCIQVTKGCTSQLCPECPPERGRISAGRRSHPGNWVTADECMTPRFQAQLLVLPSLSFLVHERAAQSQPCSKPQGQRWPRQPFQPLSGSSRHTAFPLQTDARMFLYLEDLSLLTAGNSRGPPFGH